MIEQNKKLKRCRQMKKVFVVDDSYFMREMLKSILIKEKFEIAGEACDGCEAMEKLKEIDVDIVTLDIAMANMDGLETLEKLLGMMPDIKVVMCSAMGQKPILKEALGKGARDFIVKPFTANKVVETLNKVINS